MIVWIASGFALGITLLLYAHVLLVIIGVAVIGLINFWVYYYYSYQPCFYSTYILVAILCGCGWGYGYLADHHRWQLSPQWVGKNVVVVGRVEAISRRSPVSTQFTVTTTWVNQRKVNARLSLGWYQMPHMPLPELRVGDTWRWVVRLKPVHGLHNPGGFNQERWLWLHGIQATGYIVNRVPSVCLRHASYYHLYYWRQWIQGLIAHVVPNPEIAALLSALTVGLRDQFTPPMWQVLQKTGTNHIVVIAGLHLGLLATITFMLIRYVCSLVPSLLLRFPAKWLAAISTLVIVWCYALLAGLGIPTQRAALTFTLVVIGEWCGCMGKPWHRLALAAFIILLINPLALFTDSFWLSFMACAWMAYGLLGVRGSHWRQWLRVQWVLLLGLMPLTLYCFQQLSFAMILANMVAIPWVGFLIVPLGFCGSLLALVSSQWAGAVFHGLSS